MDHGFTKFPAACVRRCRLIITPDVTVDPPFRRNPSSIFFVCNLSTPSFRWRRNSLEQCGFHFIFFFHFFFYWIFGPFVSYTVFTVLYRASASAYEQYNIIITCVNFREDLSFLFHRFRPVSHCGRLTPLFLSSVPPVVNSNVMQYCENN